MRNFLLITALLIVQSSLFAQTSEKGIVKLNNQEEVEGTVDINTFINSAVVTTADGRQLTYHASMIKSIETEDECGFARSYRCYDYRSNSFFDRLEKKVFQVVADGEITVLRRLFEYDVFDASDDYTIDEFYFVDENNQVKRLRNFKRQILPLMKSHEKEMKVFRKRNGFKNLNKEINMYLMVNYYNRLNSLDTDVVSMNQ